MDILGKIVVVRDSRAGVFVGTLVQVDQVAKTATLTGARKIHYWQGAGAVEGLAAHGSATRVTPRVEWVLLCDVVQVCLASTAAARVMLDAPEWRP